MSKPVMMHCIYRPTKGNEEALLALVRKHWPVLKKTGLATDAPALVYKALEKKTGRPFYIEIFTWSDEEASGKAHQLPEVMAVWETMGPFIEGGRGPELAVLETVSVDA